LGFVKVGYMLDLRFDAGNRPGDFFVLASIVEANVDFFERNDYRLIFDRRRLFIEPKHFFPELYKQGRIFVFNDPKEVSPAKVFNRAFYRKEALGVGSYQALYQNFRAALIKENLLPRLSSTGKKQLVCYLAIDCEKREFKSQTRLLKYFIAKVEERFGRSVHFINTGMTSSLSNELLNDADNPQRLFEEGRLASLADELGVTYTNLWGQNFYQKLKSVASVDCAISSTGTAAFLPNTLAKPLLSFGNQVSHRSTKVWGMKGEAELLIPSSRTQDIAPEKGYSSDNFKNKDTFNSYDIAQNFYEPRVDKLLNRLNL